MDNLERYERANWWIEQGVDLVPLQPGSKHLVKNYGARSLHVVDATEARIWFSEQANNLGVVLGGAFGLIVADFDKAGVYDGWRDSPGSTVETLTEKSARGYHVFFQGHEVPSGRAPSVELKTGGVVMVAPSVHPSGVIYEVVNDAPIAPLDLPRTKELFSFVSERSQVVSTAPKNKRIAGDVVSRIKAARPVSAEALTLTTLKGGDGHYYGRCSFHKDDRPSFWADDEAGLWGCYSLSCPVNALGIAAHDVINLRMWARGISIQAAIRELANEFLPPLPPAPRTPYIRRK